MSEPRQLEIVKGSNRHVIRYETGSESTVLESLVEKAKDPADDFDWFDAAVMSHQLGKELAKELKQYLPKKESPR